MMASKRARAIILAAFFLITAVAPLRPLRDPDYFWHLATGRWIHEHGALPRTDPFGAATDRVPWINGEWLFQFLVYPLHAAFGVNGIVVARALLLGALFTALLAWTSRETKSLGRALGLCTISWYGASWAFSERPATFAVLFVVLAVALTLREPTVRRIVLYALLTIVWINFHPSALLAPVIAGVVRASGALFERRAGGARHSIAMVAASALALLVNPYGIEGVLAPVLPPLASERLNKIAGGAAFAFLFVFLTTRRPSLGINEQVLPVRAAARLAALHPPGNIFSASHLGGYLIWTFYPQRRVVNDGRNELHHAFLTEYAAARRNSRDWRQLLDRYAIATAVADYEPPMRLKDARTGQVVAIPASRAFFPRSQWALIAFDDAAMVFARRAAWKGRDLSAIEIRGVDPDARGE